MRTTVLKSGYVAALALVAMTSFAGQGCDPGADPSPDIAAKALKSTSQTVDYLNRGGDDVVLLARIGQDLSEYGLTYSHMGYAVKKDDGNWVVVHKLNECGTAKANIYEQGMGLFFLDDLHKFQAGIWRLNPVIQARLKPMLLGRDSLVFHEPRYNMVAYPFSTQFQNSNGWVLEVLSAAIDPNIKSRVQSQSWLKENGYTPSIMKINAFKRLGARATKANIAFDDQPSADRWSGRISVVTVDSVVSFMKNVQDLCKSKGCVEETVVND